MARMSVNENKRNSLKTNGNVSSLFISIKTSQICYIGNVARHSNSWLELFAQHLLQQSLSRHALSVMACTLTNNSTATEHAEETQLAELLSQEAGLTSEIELKVIRNELIDYTYKDKGDEVKLQKVQVIMQSKIADQYCLAVAKLQKKKGQANSGPFPDRHHVEVYSH
jgi:hypothetical protein